jgi:hypothetical protein
LFELFIREVSLVDEFDNGEIEAEVEIEHLKDFGLLLDEDCCWTVGIRHWQ